MNSFQTLIYNELHELTWTGRILVIIAVVFAAFCVLFIARKLIKRLANSKLRQLSFNKLKTIQSILYSLIKIIVIFIAVTTILNLLGFNTRSIFAAAGVGGIAIAFGAQSIVADIISGFFILMDNEFNVGDYVILESNYEGTVQAIHLRKTLIRAYSGAIFIIPNSKINIVQNFERNNIQSDIDVFVPYEVHLEEVDEILAKLIQHFQIEDPDLFHLEPYFIGVESFLPLGYTIRIGAQTKPGDQWNGQRKLREKFLKELQRVIELKKEEEFERLEGRNE